MNGKSMRVFGNIIWGAATLGLSACGMREWFVTSDPVEVVEVARSQLCSAEQPEARIRVFESPAAVAGWQQLTGIDLRTGPLAQGHYALIEMGQHHTGGYGIAISREARIRDDVLQIYATFFSPSARGVVTQVITSPCVLVRLPGGYYREVEVYDQDGALRASSPSGSVAS